MVRTWVYGTVDGRTQRSSATTGTAHGGVVAGCNRVIPELPGSLIRPRGEGEVGFAFEGEEAVPFGEAFRLGDGADFEGFSLPAERKIGEPGVFGLPGTGADDDGPAGRAGPGSRRPAPPRRGPLP